MRKTALGLLAILFLQSDAYGQVPSFPQTLPSNTVVGRIKPGSGPSEAIPISTLSTLINPVLAPPVTITSSVIPTFTIATPGFASNDLASWNQAYTKTGAVLAGVSNQWGLITEIHIPATSSPSSYEKAAGFLQCWTADPSALPITRDCVGLDSRGNINGTLTGRAWGVVPGCFVYAGSDGICIGMEIDVFNAATADQPNQDTVTTKTALSIVPMGTQNITNGIYLVAGSGGTTMHQGIFATQSSFTPLGTDPNSSFINLSGLWRVRPDGVLIQSTAATGVIDNFQSTTAGTASTVWGVLPTTGTNTDVFQHTFNFANAVGTQYNGGVLQFMQAVATNGSERITFSLSVAKARVLQQAFAITADSHFTTGAAVVPTLTAGCNGAGSSVDSSSSDFAGTATGQTAAATTCTLTFGAAFGAAPKCVASGDTSPILTQVRNTGSLVLTFGSTANYKFSWVCFGV